MSNNDNTQRDVKLLADKIKGIRVAMMTTRDQNGMLHSRPMVAQDMEFDGDLWFFTYEASPKVENVQQFDQVNLSYSKPDDNLYISISGTAELVQDRKKIKDLWKPDLNTWFPNGEDDPKLALLKVHVTLAEYWDVPSGKGGLLYNITKGLTGSKQQAGENVQLHLEQ